MSWIPRREQYHVFRHGARELVQITEWIWRGHVVSHREWSVPPCPPRTAPKAVEPVTPPVIPPDRYPLF